MKGRQNFMSGPKVSSAAGLSQLNCVHLLSTRPKCIKYSRTSGNGKRRLTSNCRGLKNCVILKVNVVFKGSENFKGTDLFKNSTVFNSDELIP